MEGFSKLATTLTGSAPRHCSCRAINNNYPIHENWQPW
jgi:hypothetical protein